MVAGAMAPASVNGVSTMTWLWRAISMTPSSMGASMRRGELEFTTVSRLGSRSICSLEIPRAMRVISMPSRMRSRPRE